MTVHLHKESNLISARRGVRQEDTISPKLLEAALESIFRRLSWETRGLKKDGEYIGHFSSPPTYSYPHELLQMLQELADKSENQGLKMNTSKTKVMMEMTHQYMPTILQSRTLKASSTWIRDIAPETKIKTRRFKEESRPDR